MFRIILIAGLFLTAQAIADQPPIGHVKSVSGEASITTGGKQVKAEVGSPIHQGSVLQTGKKSGMGVTFKDETVMSFGADTVFTVDEYLYSPVQGNLKFSSKLARGSLNYVSGVIEKLKPDAVTVSTPTGIIGVRGTQFLLKVEE
ncbi:MAG: FecR domain-containing protein [Dechloromonas sp.]|nr:FecR domain-containing protein [Dechloromonas sp.]